MSLVSIFCIGLSTILLFAGGVFIVRRRGSSSRQTSDSARDHAVMDDRGDRVIWEMSQGFPLVDQHADRNTLARRMFFSRAALVVAGTFLSWRMARGSTDTRLLNKVAGSDAPQQPTPSTGSATEMAFLQDQHSDSHTDTHYDQMIHNDNMMPNHYDVMARNGHVDLNQHVDTEGHVDTGHNDNHYDSP